MLNRLSIILLDDHSLFINGMKFILKQAFNNIEIESFNSIKELEDRKLNLQNYDLLISDLELPNEDVFLFFKRIRLNHQIPILVISMHQKISLVKKCNNIGVNGYILKNDDDYLIHAVKEILNEKDYYSPKIKRLLSDFSLQKKLLSNREEQVIRYICEGISNQMIAERLNISIETVKTHKKNIKIKLGVTEAYQIIEFAKKNILF